MKSNKIYVIYTIDYKGTKTREGATLTVEKAKKIVDMYNNQSIKAIYEEEKLYPSNNEKETIGGTRWKLERYTIYIQ